MIFFQCRQILSQHALLFQRLPPWTGLLPRWILWLPKRQLVSVWWIEQQLRWFAEIVVSFVIPAGALSLVVIIPSFFAHLKHPLLKWTLDCLTCVILFFSLEERSIVVLDIVLSCRVYSIKYWKPSVMTDHLIVFVVRLLEWVVIIVNSWRRVLHIKVDLTIWSTLRSDLSIVLQGCVWSSIERGIHCIALESRTCKRISESLVSSELTEAIGIVNHFKLPLIWMSTTFCPRLHESWIMRIHGIMLGQVNLEQILLWSIGLRMVTFTLVRFTKARLISEAIWVVSSFVDLENTIQVCILQKCKRVTMTYSIDCMHWIVSVYIILVVWLLKWHGLTTISAEQWVMKWLFDCPHITIPFNISIVIPLRDGFKNCRRRIKLLSLLPK